MRCRLCGSGVAVLAAVALAGCGAGDAKNTSLTVHETEFKLSPANPTAKTGVVTIKVANDGRVPHSLEVEGPGEEAKLAKILPPGRSGILRVDLSKPGRYEWYCPVHGHEAKGMKGEITIT
jgi:uncharacterized cupredoxin-like copper-binding protein